jgi:class 3 adenylate cyclase
MGVCPSCGEELPAAEFPFCPWCSAPLKAPDAGARKTVSILFCDLVDSTALGSSVDAEVLRGVLSGYWGRARSVVERHGGTVEKFIGDAVVAVFGIPVVHEDDALRAVRAASELLLEVRDLNQDLRPRLGIELAVRIGVNTGEVLSGVGGEGLMSGDATNVAARLQTAAAAGEVLLGESTYRLVRGAVDAEDVGPLSVKGKAQPLVAYRLVGVHAGAVGRRRFAGPLVGRRRQLRLAEEMYATAVEESACVLLTVLGEPGVGKSRLVQELLAGIGDQALVLSGRCLSYGVGITFWPTIEMLTGLAETDGMTLAEHLSGVEHAAEILAALDTMAGRAETATGQEVAWAFRRLIETLAMRRPVVLVIDDLQWAEPGLLDLLDHITDMSRGVPILLVCMARPEFRQTRAGWGSGRQHSFAMALSPLSDSECHQLTAQVLGARVGTALLDKVVAASEGVPLFVEELTAMLVDEGQLVPAVEGGWQVAAGLDEVVVPPSVQALVAARLDGLAADLREVVDVASVIGKTFYPDALVVLVDDAAVLQRVEALVRADLVQPTTTDLAGHDAYTFSHQLLRDAAYHGLTKVRRAVLHEGLARWLQQQPITIASSDVAYHLEAAATYGVELGEPDLDLAEEAAHLLLTAADRALTLADITTAVHLANRAAPLAPATSRLRAEIALTLSAAADAAGDGSTAVQCAADAERIGVSVNDDAMQWRARIQRGLVESRIDPSRRADGMYILAGQAIEALTAAGDDRGLTVAYVSRAEAHSTVGRLRAGAADARQGLFHAHRADRAGTYQWRLLDWIMGPCRFGDGTPTEMEETLDEISVEFGDDPGVKQAIATERDILPAYQGRLEEGLERSLEHFRLGLEKGSTLRATMRLADGVSWCQRWAGDLVGAAESLGTAEQLLDAVGETSVRSTRLADRAVILAILGRDDEARTAVAQSRAISQENDLINDVLYATADTLLLAHQGDSEGSELSFLEGLEIVDATEFLPVKGELWLTRSFARESLGDTAGALAAAQQALACFERKGQIPPIRTAVARVASLGG